jgi:potassium-dependent mechanosensitive channel
LMALPAALSALVLTLGLDHLNLLVHELSQLAPTVLSSFIIFIAVSALAKTILSPGRPSWRLVDLADAPAKSVTRYLIWIAAFFAADRVLSELARLLFLPVSVSVLIASICSGAIGFLLIKLARTRFERLSTAAPDFRQNAGLGDTPAPALVSLYEPKLLKLPLLLTALLILGAVALGYVALGRFVVEQLVATGGVIAVVLLLHLAIRAMLGAPGSGIKPIETILAERAGLSDEQGNAIAHGVALSLNAVLATLAVPLVLLTWGYTLPEAFGWLKSLLFGFEIGQFKISFARIFLALGLFLGVVLVTRLIQRWLRSGVLENAKIDRGIANSIHTAVGYTGFTLAALTAVSYAGLDITNFAIVAGALSVGIGFGLQSIVSNFVSGLILLVERPIKVGDWVSVKGQEGFVRRIAVRSTEIETSDRASLIVPNSDLITSTVTNWTHRNALGRVVVPVVVDVHNDPEKVREILQKVAQECTLLMQHPTPTIAFEDMNGDLKFSVRAVIPDVSRSTAVQTELRTRIMKALRASGIIPLSAQEQALTNPGVVLEVAVGFDNDPAHVRAILQQVATDCPLLLQPPVPSVSFDDMAGDLKFSIRAVMPAGSKPIDVETELRTRVLNALRAAGVTFAKPSHDIYLRDLDGVKLLLAKIMAERAAQTVGDGASEAAPEPTPAAPPTPQPIHPAYPAAEASHAPSTPSQPSLAAKIRPIRKDAQSSK